MKKQRSISKKNSISKVIDGNTPGYESFASTINFLIGNASKVGISLTHNDITEKLGISDDKFKAFYAADTAPPEIFALLKSQFKEFLPGNIEIIAYKFDVEVDAPDPDPMEED